MRKPIISMYERLDIHPNPVTGKWVLSKTFTFYKWSKWCNECIIIPAWFEFDWASIPRLFWVIWHPMWIDTLIAALIHDYIYSNHSMTRKEADELFNEVMIICEVKTIKRILYYIGVRVWWWLAWNNNKKALQNTK